MHLQVFTNDTEFDQLAADWADLLSRSACNPLFNSWPWQRAWWQVWARRLELQLHIVAIYLDDASGQLLGLLPICFSPRDKAYAFLGALPRSTFRSELLDAIVDTDAEDAVSDQFSAHLITLLGSAKFHAADVPRQANISRILQQLSPVGRVLLLGHTTMAEDTVYQVDCDAGFSHYVGTLGKNSRLKLFNRRTYLKQHYPEAEVFEERLTDGNHHGRPSVRFLSFQPAFDRFHRLRWNKPFLGQDGLDFQSCFTDFCEHWNELCIDLPHVRISPLISVLQHQRTAVSLLYDIVAGDTRYNMQMGFSEDFDKKLSLGTLHLGYAIEAACEAGLRHYSFLAGTGRLAEASYKTHLATSSSGISTSCTAANHRFLELMCRDLARCALHTVRR
ncbi:hypothetical protein GCM10022278_39300 [Allohahella marinimesophila]|uniref:BioF2-like acetyltransferase domain-containing protein n=1 Tax=Allohahella marinimesophila TaxID=1054972 RepID=A0ABP7QAA4_9GAMM